MLRGRDRTVPHWDRDVCELIGFKVIVSPALIHFFAISPQPDIYASHYHEGTRKRAGTLTGFVHSRAGLRNTADAITHPVSVFFL
jgi:hypothetical protein